MHNNLSTNEIKKDPMNVIVQKVNQNKSISMNLLKVIKNIVIIFLTCLSVLHSTYARKINYTTYSTNGCTLSSTIMAPTFVGGFNVSCNGAADGSIEFYVSSGTPIYNYLWSNGQTNKDMSGLSS